MIEGAMCTIGLACAQWIGFGFFFLSGAVSFPHTFLTHFLGTMASRCCSPVRPGHHSLLSNSPSP